MNLPVLPASRSIALTLLQSTTTTVFLTTDVIDGECYGYAIFVDDWHLRAFVIWYVTSFYLIVLPISVFCLEDQRGSIGPCGSRKGLYILRTNLRTVGIISFFSEFTFSISQFI